MPGLLADTLDLPLYAGGLNTIDVNGGIARVTLVAAEPGTLYVEASIGGVISSLSVPVINAQSPYLPLSAPNHTRQRLSSHTTERRIARCP